MSLTGVEVGEAILGPVLSCLSHSHTLVGPTVQTLEIDRHTSTHCCEGHAHVGLPISLIV